MILVAITETVWCLLVPSMFCIWMKCYFMCFWEN